VGLTASGSRGASARAPATDGAKEKELLEALERRGKLTVAGVALETSLTVEEADRMLSALAAKGHLEVTVARGRLLYSLWERDGTL
jgi:predicted ArsR family transcriptional regulator